MQMSLDPFEFKKYSKIHPARLGFTAYARSAELYSRLVFDRVQLEYLEGDEQREVRLEPYEQQNTAVSPRQMGALLHYLREAEDLPGTAVVEIGSYRGITTAHFSKAVTKAVYAVDPFIGYGGAEDDYQIFMNNTRDLASVHHVRETSGAASQKWPAQNISFLFIDAVHDYVNTKHDIATWSEKLIPGGMMAMHDTDNAAFAGTRYAAWQAAQKMRIVCHIPDLVILSKP